MRFEISNEGVPLGTADLLAEGLAIGDNAPSGRVATMPPAVRHDDPGSEPDDGDAGPANV